MINHGIFHGSTKKHAANETDPRQSCERAVQGPAHRYPRDAIFTRVEPLVPSSAFNRQKRTSICEVIVPKPWVFIFFCLTNGQKHQTWIPDFFFVWCTPENSAWNETFWWFQPDNLSHWGSSSQIWFKINHLFAYVRDDSFMVRW